MYIYRQTFMLDITLPSDTGDNLFISLFSPQNQDIRQGCGWSGEPQINDGWTVNLVIFNY